MDVTAQYTEYCYNKYYEKSIDWDAYYEHLAEEDDRKWEELEND